MCILFYSDGCGRTGSFIAIYYALERVKVDSIVDFLQAVKSFRISRTSIVANAVSVHACPNAQ